MFCTECGNPVSDDASFCSVCGAQIERPIDDKSTEEILIFDNDGLIDISNLQSPPDNSGGGNGGYTGGGNGGPTDGGGGSVAGGGAVGGDGDGNGGHAGGGNGGYVSGGVGATPRGIVPLIAGILVGIAALAALVFFVLIPATNGAFSKYKGNGTNTSAETQGVNDWCVSDGTWLYYFTRTTTPADDDGTYSIVVQIKRVRLTGGDEQTLYTYTYSNCDGDEDVGLEELYLAEGRVYFIQSIWENGEQQCSLRSVTTEGTDLVSLTDNASTPIEVSEGRIYQCTERGIYSSPLLGHEGDSYWAYESDDIIDWVVDDGYLYVVEIKFAGDSVIRMIRRISLEDGRIETLYTCTNTYIYGFAPFDGQLYLNEDVNGINQLVSVDIETGKETTLFVSDPEDSDYSYREITAWSVTSDGIFVVFYDPWTEEPFVLYRVAPDGSGTTAIYTYDSTWAGNPLESRNIGAHPHSELAYLFVCNGKAYFIPYSWDVENAYMTVDSDAPIYYSICAVDLDNGQFEVTTTESTIIDM